MLNTLFSQYDKLVLFDTETTGLNFCRDEIFVFAGAVLERQEGEIRCTQEYDQLISLSPGGFIPQNIQTLTGITDQDVREQGIQHIRLLYTGQRPCGICFLTPVRGRTAVPTGHQRHPEPVGSPLSIRFQAR